MRNSAEDIICGGRLVRQGITELGESIYIKENMTLLRRLKVLNQKDNPHENVFFFLKKKRDWLSFRYLPLRAMFTIAEGRPNHAAIFKDIYNEVESEEK